MGPKCLEFNMKIRNKILTSALCLGMVASMASPVFASDTSENPDDTHHTDITYTVTQSYKWSAPADFSFTANQYSETQTGEVKILENIIEGGKTLNIKINGDADGHFKVKSAEGIVRNFEMNKNDADGAAVNVNDIVCSAAAGTNTHTETLAFTLLNPDGGRGTVLGTKQLSAGSYTGLVNFTASID